MWLAGSLQIPTIFVGNNEGEILRRAAIAGNAWVELHCGRAQLIEDRQGHLTPPIPWPPEDICASSPCENGATCLSGVDPTTLHLSGTKYVYSEYTCKCHPGFSGEHCESLPASKGEQSTCKDDPAWRNWVTQAGCAEYNKSNATKQWCHTDRGSVPWTPADFTDGGSIDPINRLIDAYEGCPASCGAC